MRAAYQNLFDNPILTRELRRRMRGKALIFSIIGYIIIMTVTSILILLTSMNPFVTYQSQNAQSLLQAMVNTGSLLFNAIFVIQSLLVLIIAPTITAGMTTMEKERKTFDFLRVTTITPWMYIIGSFLSTVFYVSLALLCALPLISLSFLYGGVSNTQVIERLIQLLGTSMVLSALGLYISSIRERTRTAQGIVVFLIFAMLFGGTIGSAFLSNLFGTGTATTQQASPQILGFTISSTTIMVLGFCVVTTVFLLMATRKLFEPEDTRALNHWQFAVLYLLIMACMILPAATLNIGNIYAVMLSSMMAGLLAVAAINFAVGRMEVGDEIWHMKRLIPILRPFDQTIPFLILLALATYFFTDLFLNTIPANNQITNTDGIWYSTYVSLASFFFFCSFARFATAISVGRKQAGRLTIAAVILLWIVLPIIAIIILNLMQEGGFGNGIIASLLLNVGRFSPFVVVINSMFANQSTVPELFELSILLPIITYIFLGIVFLAIGEPKRWKRWKGFSWHYDMPSR